GIEGPAAILERTPGGVDKIGLPKGSIAGDGRKAAVIAEIAHAVRIWRRNIVAADGITVVIFGLLPIPAVVSIFFVLLGQLIALAEQVKSRPVFLGNFERPRLARDPDLTFENSEGSFVVCDANSEMSRLGKRDRLTAKFHR